LVKTSRKIHTQTEAQIRRETAYPKPFRDQDRYHRDA